MKVGDTLNIVSVETTEHVTEPPARYSDATLVKAMEEQGIGRPSTYAPTIATIIDRNYVERDEHKRLAPTTIAFAVNDLLVEHFPNIVDKAFTAHMEAQFDRVAQAEESWQTMLEEFYTPFHAGIVEKQETLGRSALPEEHTDEVCEACGKPMAVKWSRFGKFLACSAYPECKHTLRLNKDGSIQRPVPPRLLGTDPNGGGQVSVQSGRFGPYVQSTVQGEAKPKRASLLAGMTPESVTLEQALGLLAFPRVLASEGEPITVRQGRFGPYVSQGKESRSLPKDASYTALTITLEEAKALLATPKPTRGFRRPRKTTAKEA
jgi:DNA topoisomerase-1